MTRFRAGADQFLDVWESDARGTDFVPGAALTLTYWRDQRRVCKEVGADFLPPRPDQLVVISAGVLEGDPVQGVRYPSPEHMSGWWVTTDRYDGDVASLRTEHLYHLTAARPELARYICLPYGFRFGLERGERVYVDDAVARLGSPIRVEDSPRAGCCPRFSGTFWRGDRRGDDVTPDVERVLSEPGHVPRSARDPRRAGRNHRADDRRPG